jgi:hypothetical protein
LWRRARELISSLRYAWLKWVSTVLIVTKSVCAISLLRVAEDRGRAEEGQRLLGQAREAKPDGDVGQCPERRDLGFALQEQDGGSIRRRDTHRRHRHQSVDPSEPTALRATSPTWVFR